jgi:hypothetical protein
MTLQPLFSGLIIDQNGEAVEIAYVGDEPFYVVNDAGFRRHIPAAQVDHQVFEAMGRMIEGHEDIISEQTAKMMGQDDPFSKAMIANQLKQMDKQFENLIKVGIPEEVRAYLGMMGFRIIINVHGEVIDIQQPGIESPDEE